MREDQDAEVARRLDEAGGGDRLAGRGRVAEAVAARRARVVARERRLLVARRRRSTPASKSSSSSSSSALDLDDARAVAVAVAVLVGVALVRGDQLGQHPGERVDLVAAQLGAGRELPARRREHALEAEHEAVADPPARRRRRGAGVDLGERVVERRAARGARARARRAGSSPAWRNGSPYQAWARSAAASRPSAGSDVDVGLSVASRAYAQHTMCVLLSLRGSARSRVSGASSACCTNRGRACGSADGYAGRPASRRAAARDALRDAGLVEVLRDPAAEEREAGAEDQARVDLRAPIATTPSSSRCRDLVGERLEHASWISSTVVGGRRRRRRRPSRRPRSSRASARAGSGPGKASCSVWSTWFATRGPTIARRADGGIGMPSSSDRLVGLLEACCRARAPA